jgi:hypothetical protein
MLWDLIRPKFNQYQNSCSRPLFRRKTMWVYSNGSSRGVLAYKEWHQSWAFFEFSTHRIPLGARPVQIAGHKRHVSGSLPAKNHDACQQMFLGLDPTQIPDSVQLCADALRDLRLQPSVVMLGDFVCLSNMRVFPKIAELRCNVLLPC